MDEHASEATKSKLAGARCRSCIPEEEERFKEMQEKIWKVNHPNEPMPNAAAAEDEDIVVAASGSDLARNTKCPITAKEVRSQPMPLSAEMHRVPA